MSGPGNVTVILMYRMQGAGAAQKVIGAALDTTDHIQISSLCRLSTVTHRH